MRLRLLLASALLLAPHAWAQRKNEDDALPYSEQEDERRQPGEARHERREETEVEQRDRQRSLADLDDPNVGLSFEVLLGSMFLESSRGQGVEPRFSGGLRFTWEWSRTLLSDEYWREAFLLDVNWWATSWGDGTKDVYDHTTYHYFTLAPAWALPFGKSAISFYAQVGAGLSYQTSSLFVQQQQTDISGLKFLFQYGLGFRARPAVLADGKLRVSFRLEVSRLHRGYMDDTFFGGSLGLTF